MAGPSRQDEIEPRAELSWQPDAMRAYPWLADLAEVPEDASPPLWMSLPADDAVCSYGWDGCTHNLAAVARSFGFIGPMPAEPDAVTWINRSLRVTLRWWQRLATVRQLEHRADGTLCWRVVLESAPRRAGKSVRIRGVALWRMAIGATLFGERQEIVHTGSDIAVCRKVQKDAWRWSFGRGWTVTKANGKEAIETDDGDAWLVRAQDAVYGWDTTLGIVDEAWDVKPDAVSEGLEPSLMERHSAQLHMTSTAHRRARSTMKKRLLDVLTRDDGETLVIVWAAAPSVDVTDPQTWRDASPHWSEDRRRMVGGKLERAMAGQADPEIDDPDPVRGWAAQYLNQWPLSTRPVVHGDALVDDDGWSRLVALPDLESAPTGAAIESWFSAGVSLALGWRDGERVTVQVTDHPDLADAVAALKASRYRGRTTVGASLEGDPALRGVATTSSSQRIASAVSDLARLLKEGHLWHDGGDHLTGQVLAVRTTEGPDGARMVSKGRADAVKAATWAAAAARAKPAGGSVGIVLPTGVSV